MLQRVAAKCGLQQDRRTDRPPAVRRPEQKYSEAEELRYLTAGRVHQELPNAPPRSNSVVRR